MSSSSSRPFESSRLPARLLYVLVQEAIPARMSGERQLLVPRRDIGPREVNRYAVGELVLDAGVARLPDQLAYRVVDLSDALPCGNRSANRSQKSRRSTNNSPL